MFLVLILSTYDTTTTTTTTTCQLRLCPRQLRRASQEAVSGERAQQAPSREVRAGRRHPRGRSEGAEERGVPRLYPRQTRTSVFQVPPPYVKQLYPYVQQLHQLYSYVKQLYNTKCCHQHPRQLPALARCQHPGVDPAFGLPAGWLDLSLQSLAKPRLAMHLWLGVCCGGFWGGGVGDRVWGVGCRM